MFIFFFFAKTSRDVAIMSIKDGARADGARAVVGIPDDVKLNIPVIHKHNKDMPEIQALIEARNNISRLLNLKQQELGRLQCEVRFIILRG